MLSVERRQFSLYINEIINPPVAVGMRTRMSLSAYIQFHFRGDVEKTTGRMSSFETPQFMDCLSKAAEETGGFFPSFSARESSIKLTMQMERIG
jgi:hypothetical protein